MNFPWSKEEKINRESLPFIGSNNLDYLLHTYPDGSKYVEIIRMGPNLTFHINSYEDLWILNQIHDTVVYNNPQQRVVVTIPNLLDAQADRRFKPNEPHALKLVCKLLNQMVNFNFIIHHPHNPEVVEVLIDNVRIMNNSNLVENALYEIFKTKSTPHRDVPPSYAGIKLAKATLPSDVILMSADAGGYKPLMKLADKLEWKGEVYSASKSRSYVDGKSKVTQIVDRQDFGGKDIVIIDDICVGGGTFKGLSKLLRERNCGKIYLVVSHMTIQDLGLDPVTNYFEKVFTTNSKFDSYTINDGTHDDSRDNLYVLQKF